MMKKAKTILDILVGEEKVKDEFKGILAVAAHSVLACSIFETSRLRFEEKFRDIFVLDFKISYHA